MADESGRVLRQDKGFKLCIGRGRVRRVCEATNVRLDREARSTWVNGSAIRRLKECEVWRVCGEEVPVRSL